MNIKALLFILALLTVGITNAQSLIFKPAYLKYELDRSTKSKILASMDTLFSQIKLGKINEALINKDNNELNMSTMQSFAGIEENKKDSILDFYKKQLINIYPISTFEFWISLAFIGEEKNKLPILQDIINLIATNVNNNIVFSIPIKYLTKTWKTEIVGNVTYFFRDKINKERAAKFNAKNTTIANKLGLQPEKINFYLCNNYQEVLQLLGYEYDAESNGKTREGFGVDAGNIFSIMNNEDFSHDVFHYYSSKIRADVKRNRTVEEGIAYSWGNAYYTKANGEMIEQKELVQDLKSYLRTNQKASLFELFNQDTKIFDRLPTEISVKSTISSLLCDEVERQKGVNGIKTLIKSGGGDDNFFKTLNDLVSINQTNFNAEVMKLIKQYKDK